MYTHTRSHTRTTRATLTTKPPHAADHAASWSWRYRWSLADDHESRRCLKASAAARRRLLAGLQGMQVASNPDETSSLPAPSVLEP